MTQYTVVSVDLQFKKKTRIKQETNDEVNLYAFFKKDGCTYNM